MKAKICSRSGFLGSHALLVLVLCAGAACPLVTAIPTTLGLGFFRLETPAKDSQRTLTFEERVAYQRAIEKVYWRHRLWPRNGGERPDPKPSFDAVMSQAPLEKTVAAEVGN